MGLFNRAVDRIRSAATGPDLSGNASVADAGLTEIAATRDRARARVRGRIESVSPPTSAGVSALDVEIADRTGTLHLLFVGRPAIPGINPGIELTVEGLVSSQAGRRVMYNPSYEIVPRKNEP